MEFFIEMESVLNHIQNNVDTLLIDFDDTLVDYPSAEHQALKSLLSHYGLKVEQYPDVFEKYNNINNSLWPLLEKGKKTIPEIREERFRILKESIPFDDEPVTLDSKYLDYFVENTKISEINFKSLQSLSRVGLNMIITTNGIRSVQRRRVKHIGIDSLVDEVITSEDVGKAKPSPLLFETALTKYSSSSEKGFVIGDSLSSDILGANNASIMCCWISHGREFINGEIAKPDMITHNFSMIAKFIVNHKTA